LVRLSIRAIADALRSFFRHAGLRHSREIDPLCFPRIYPGSLVADFSGGAGRQVTLFLLEIGEAKNAVAVEEDTHTSGRVS
jgi:hypothetical protein